MKYGIVEERVCALPLKNISYRKIATNITHPSMFCDVNEIVMHLKIIAKQNNFTINFKEENLKGKTVLTYEFKESKFGKLLHIFVLSTILN